jgi:hypothetical protein
LNEKIEVPGSMYNLIHGMNPMSIKLLAMLKLTMADFGRFRDVTEISRVINKEGEFLGLRIVVLTRTGGDNRDEYQDTINALRKHKSYLEDGDDVLDNTYMYFVFFLKGKGEE